LVVWFHLVIEFLPLFPEINKIINLNEKIESFPSLYLTFTLTFFFFNRQIKFLNLPKKIKCYLFNPLSIQSRVIILVYYYTKGVE
jgi:hypothetical protein